MPPSIAYVTGANGFVGSHLVEYLLSQGLDVHCLLRASSNDKWLQGLPITIHRSGIENVSALKEIFRLHPPTYIFHLAGTVTALTLDAFMDGNVKPTESILQASLDSPSIQKIIITSSLAASSPTTVGHPIVESTPHNPLTDYGQSKVAEERLALSYMDRLPISIVRPPVVYGERETEVFLFFKTIKSHLLPLIGFHPKTLSIVYVRDLVRGMYQCATSDRSTGETYFLGGFRPEYTWLEMGSTASKILSSWTIRVRVPHVIVFILAFVFQHIANLMGRSPVLNMQKAREMVSASWSCKSDKASEHFDYQPQVDILEGFGHTIQWYLEHKWL